MQSKTLTEPTAELMHNWANCYRDRKTLGYTQCPTSKGYRAPDWGVIEAPPGQPRNADAERIEKAIVFLGKQEPMLANYILYRWLFGYSVRKLGKRFGTNKNIASEKLMRAESALEVVLWTIV